MADDSDDKTQDPTQKRLDDAHARGDVAKSQEVNTWFVIAGGTLVLSTFSGSMGGGILTPLRNVIANAGQLHADGAALLGITGRIRASATVRPAASAASGTSQMRPVHEEVGGESNTQSPYDARNSSRISSSVRPSVTRCATRSRICRALAAGESFTDSP